MIDGESIVGKRNAYKETHAKYNTTKFYIEYIEFYVSFSNDIPRRM